MPLLETSAGSVFFAEHNQNLTQYAPVILIHGAGSSHLGWSKEMRRLPERRVITLDLPGHGRSPGPGQDTVEGYARAVLGLLDALEMTGAVLVGHSMGGAISQWLALHQAERVTGLVLIGTGAFLNVNPELLRLLQEDYLLATELITKWSWHKEIDPAIKARDLAALRQTPQHILYGDYLACSRFDVREQVRQISAPALIIGGTADKMTPLAINQFLVDNMPQSRWVQIEGGGHSMMLEQAEQVGAIVAAWLKEQA